MLYMINLKDILSWDNKLFYLLDYFLFMETIVCGDIHGRQFWRKLLNDKTDRTIVFLGDYLDPYDIDPRDAINNFLDVLEFAENNPRVKLLIGNHDCWGLFDYISCRHDWDNKAEIKQIFNEYKHLLNFAYKENNAIFTHAGISNDWINTYDLQFLNQDNVVDYLNSNPETLWKIGRSRGGRDFASCPLWQCWYGDWPYDENPFMCTQIFGHTQLSINKPQHDKEKKIINCDCREVLIWDGENIKLYE